MTTLKKKVYYFKASDIAKALNIIKYSFNNTNQEK
jgi:hypothetical protein